MAALRISQLDALALDSMLASGLSDIALRAFTTLTVRPKAGD
jgi:hypothetical protein